MLNILNSQAGTGSSNWLQVIILLTLLTLIPTILIMTTSFTRIVVVLSFIRNALGIQQMPPNQIIIGMALFITLFVMSPTINTINKEAVQPFINKQITQEQAIKSAELPLKQFMFKQTRSKDVALFVKLAKIEKPKSIEDIPITVLIPAFIISELRIAFQIGFLIYIPFLLIDIIVSSILMSMGMMMVPPVVISAPFKILLFVMVDGWYLIINSLVTSFK